MEIIRERKTYKTVGELNVGDVFRVVDFENLGLFMILEDYDYLVDLENNLMRTWEGLGEEVLAYSDLEDIDKAEAKVYECKLVLTD